LESDTEIPFRLARPGDLFRAGTSEEIDFLITKEPTGEILVPGFITLGLTGRYGKIRKLRALRRYLLQIR
jgi:hypothetical protein